MSATATSSEPTGPAAAGRTRRSVWAPRWLVVTHRYLGVALGGLMLAWCLSGMVMLFVAYPSVGQDERLARLPRIDWSHCCVMDAAAPATARVRVGRHRAAGRVAPVLRLRLGGRAEPPDDRPDQRPCRRRREPQLDAHGRRRRPGAARPAVTAGCPRPVDGRAASSTGAGRSGASASPTRRPPTSMSRRRPRRWSCSAPPSAGRGR